MLDLRKVFGRRFRGRMMHLLRFVPDKLYLQIFFFACNWKFINFKNPKTFCDKLNWMKLYDRHPEYSKLADKLLVREHIKETLGEEYVLPIYGHWKSFDEIDFDSLPEQFVLKCNHDSGSVRIIRNKSDLTDLDIKELREFYNRRIKNNFFYAGREFPYKGINRYIFAEKFMQSKTRNTETFCDYKWMCFNGEPEFMYIETERSSGVKMSCFNMNYEPLDIIGDKPKSTENIPKSPNFDSMREMARKLSQGIKFVRIDFRELDGNVYFGEYTFYENGAFRPYKPEKWEYYFGDLININN